MVTYAELAAEPVWGQQITPPNMLSQLVEPLRAFYNMGPALIGAPGDNRHLRGRHRSRDWDLTSVYCTNRTYATTDARDKDGSGSWYRAVDVGITGVTLYAAARRMDALVRSGETRVAEWFGTFDGVTVVGWFEGHSSTSDSSHLYHLHVGVWTRWADDADLMALLYRTITGTGEETATMLCMKGDKDANNTNPRNKPVTALQESLLKLNPNALPNSGVDGWYGGEVAKALVDLGLTVGGDPTGNTFGPQEWANLLEAIGRLGGADSGVPKHEHKFTMPAQDGQTGGIVSG